MSLIVDVDSFMIIRYGIILDQMTSGYGVVLTSAHDKSLTTDVIVSRCKHGLNMHGLNKCVICALEATKPEPVVETTKAQPAPSTKVIIDMAAASPAEVSTTKASPMSFEHLGEHSNLRSPQLITSLSSCYFETPPSEDDPLNPFGI